MQISSDDPFWRGDSMARATPWLAGAAAFGAVVGAFAWLAQHNEQVYYVRTIPGAPGLGELYSLPLHVLAMTLLATFAVSVAASLASQGGRTLAALTLAATAAGPMAVIAAPLDESAYSQFTSPSLAWQASVAAGLAVLLAAWTVWVVRRAGAPSGSRPAGPIHDTTVFAGLFAAGFGVAMLLRPDTPETPSFLTIACWTVLSATAAIALWRARGVRSLGISVLPALTLGAMYLAYFRPGGWPGVAGWELWTSPIVFGIPSVAMSLSLPIAVWAVRAARAARASASHGAASEAAPAT